MNKEQIEVLKKLNDFLKNIDQCGNKELLIIKHAYGQLTQHEQEEIIRILCESLDGISKERFMILSMFIDDNKSPYLLEMMADAAVEADYSIEEYYMILVQLRYAVFTLPGAGEKYIDKLYHCILGKVTDEMKPEWQYIKYSDRRDNKIVILTDQLIGERHSPTQVVVNLLYYLQRAGYDVQILIVNEKRIGLDESLWLSRGIEMANGIEEDGDFCLNYFGIDVRVHNVLLTTERLKQCFYDAIDWIYNINPAFVIQMGGTSIVADIASRFTTVISKTLSKNVPITASKYCMYEDTIDMKVDEILNAGTMIALKCKYQNLLCPKEIGDEEMIRQIADVSKMKVLIVGNRLDDEIDDKFIDFMDEQIARLENMMFVMVGNCPKLESRMTSKYSEDRIRFAGYIKNLAGMTEVCDIFLNPPRSGGGYSSHIALKKGLPIITLGDCDVYNWAGDNFVCKDLDDMSDTLRRYYEDTEFRNKKIKESRERCAEMELSEEEGIENTKRFCEELKAHVLADEKESDDQ